MKREIKFRIWNGQQMEYNIMAGFLGAFYVQGIDEKDPASMSPFNTKYFDDTPLMQFTGLTDKNGKEIYEGDIIESNGHETILVHDFSSARKFVNSNIKDSYKSEFSRFKFECYWNNHFYGYDFNPIKNNTHINADVSDRDYEVIGNIYENSDLLKIVKP